MIDNWTNADLGAHAPTVPGTVEAWVGEGGYTVIEDTAIGEHAIIEGDSVVNRR